MLWCFLILYNVVKDSTFEMKWFYITGLLLKGSDFPEDHSTRGLSGVLNVSLLWWHPIGFFYCNSRPIFSASKYIPSIF